jgi:hypothetical protein
MIRWLRKKSRKPKFYLNPFGELRLQCASLWFGRVDSFCGQKHRVELEIEVEYYDEPNSEQLLSLRLFSEKWEQLEMQSYKHVYAKNRPYKGYSKEAKELKEMYFLGSVTLNLDGTFWIVLEPGDVPSIYNHFECFRIKDGVIIHSSID